MFNPDKIKQLSELKTTPEGALSPTEAKSIHPPIKKKQEKNQNFSSVMDEKTAEKQESHPLNAKDQPGIKTDKSGSIFEMAKTHSGNASSKEISSNPLHKSPKSEIESLKVVEPKSNNAIPTPIKTLKDQNIETGLEQKTKSVVHPHTDAIVHTKTDAKVAPRVNPEIHPEAHPKTNQSADQTGSTIENRSTNSPQKTALNSSYQPNTQELPSSAQQKDSDQKSVSNAAYASVHDLKKAAPTNQTAPHQVTPTKTSASHPLLSQEETTPHQKLHLGNDNKGNDNKGKDNKGSIYDLKKGAQQSAHPSSTHASSSQASSSQASSNQASSNQASSNQASSNQASSNLASSNHVNSSAISPQQKDLEKNSVDRSHIAPYSLDSQKKKSQLDSSQSHLYTDQKLNSHNRKETSALNLQRDRKDHNTPLQHNKTKKNPTSEQVTYNQHDQKIVDEKKQSTKPHENSTDSDKKVEKNKTAEKAVQTQEIAQHQQKGAENVQSSFIEAPIASNAVTAIGQTTSPTAPQMTMEEMQEMISQMAKSLYQMENSGKTETTLTLNSSNIFKGASIQLTEFDTAKGEFNITFAGLTLQGKEILTNEDNINALKQAMESRGYVLHIITATQQPLETTTPFDQEGGYNLDKENEEEAKDQQEQEENEEES